MNNTSGLTHLTWDLFDCPLQEGSAIKFMERTPVLLLDKYVRKTGRTLTINLAYTSPEFAKKKPLPSKSSHRVGLAVRVKCLNSKFRMQLISFLLFEGVRRISFSRDEIYFDTDPLKAPMLEYGFEG